MVAAFVHADTHRLKTTQQARQIARPGGVAASLLLRDNLRHRRDIENAYLDAIAGAQIRVLISSAYFLPGRRFRKALQEAARRGVAVTLLLQGRSDHVLMQYPTRALYARLLAAGVRIFEYHQGFLRLSEAGYSAVEAVIVSGRAFRPMKTIARATCGPR